MDDASNANESYLSAGKHLTEGFVKGIADDDPDVSKVIESYLFALFRSMGLPISILAGAYSNLSSVFKLYPNRRVEHLAKYGKKHRTRKKNSNRASIIIAGGF